MKHIFLSVALATTIYSSAQNTYDTNRSIELNRAINRASEWSKASELEGKKIDSSKLVKKTITQELALPKALDVLIDMSGELIINTWNENKVKIETTILVENPNELTDTQWLEKANINMKVFGSAVRVKTRTNNNFISLNSKTLSGFTTSSSVYYNNGNFQNLQTGPVTLYIPAESLLEIESKYGHLKITNNIKSLLLDNNDGEIDFANIEKLQIRSNRGSFTGGTVTNADLELSHVRFSLKQLDKAVVTCNYSTIEIESLKDVKLSSSNDEIDIDNAASLYGVKNYGNLRINQLTSKLDIQGVNADIKLRHVSPSAQLIKIINRNADLRLPTTELSSFTIDVKGSYNKIYSSFAENTIVDTLSAAETESIKTMTDTVISAGPTVSVAGTTFSNYSVRPTKITNRPIAGVVQVVGINRQNPFIKYSAKIGTGSASKYEIVCTSCVIDFK